MKRSAWDLARPKLARAITEYLRVTQEKATLTQVHKQVRHRNFAGVIFTGKHTLACVEPADSDPKAPTSFPSRHAATLWAYPSS
jgi:hypothetical protein